QKLRATLAGVVEQRKEYHKAVLHHAALAWLRSAWSADDATQGLTRAQEALRTADSTARQAEADEEAAYAEEHAARRELDSLQQPPQGEGVQAAARAGEPLPAAQHNQARAARELRQAEERLPRSEQAAAAARPALDAEQQAAATRLTELHERATKALGQL